MKRAWRLLLPALLVTVAAVAFVAGCGTLVLLAERGFGTRDFNLALHTQGLAVFWHGTLQTTLAQGFWPTAHGTTGVGWFAPLFLLWPRPGLLLVLQVLALAAAAGPIFLLARRHWQDGPAAALLAVAWLALPPVFLLATDGFDPTCFAVPLLLGALYCTRAARTRWALLWLVLAASFQHDALFGSMLVCGYAYFVHAQRRPEAARVVLRLAICFFIWFIVVYVFTLRSTEAFGRLHYFALAAPFLVLLAVLTLPWLPGLWSKKWDGLSAGTARAMAGLVLAVAVVAHGFWGVVPWLDDHRAELTASPVANAKRAAVHQLPAAATVVATPDLLPRVAARAGCWSISQYLDRRGPQVSPDYVLLDFDDPALAGAWQLHPLDRTEQLGRWRALFGTGTWRCSRWFNSFAVFQREDAPVALPPPASNSTWTAGPQAVLTDEQTVHLDWQESGSVHGVPQLRLRLTWTPPRGAGAAAELLWAKLELVARSDRERVHALWHGPCRLLGGNEEEWMVSLHELPPGEYDGVLLLGTQGNLQPAPATAGVQARLPIGKVMVTFDEPK